MKNQLTMNQHNPTKQSPFVQVTQPHLPNKEKFKQYIDVMYENGWVTNGGPLLDQLTERLKKLLGVKYLLVVNNGTSALQLAYRVKNLSNKSVISSPFTFPATLTALEWQNINTLFGDIDKSTWNLDVNSTEHILRSSSAGAVVPINIFGCPCDLEAFDKIGNSFGVPIIYDSAQSMLSIYKGKRIFEYGDIHCISFHATKLFHCIEGGAITFNNKSDYERAKTLINFGINNKGEVHEPGINAKMSEVHAAMGLCVLDELPELVSKRQHSVDLYKSNLLGHVEFQKALYESYTPPMYMPIKLEDQKQLKQVSKALAEHGFMTREYFHPSRHKFLGNKVDHLANVNNIANTILCLPLMYQLEDAQIEEISRIVRKVI